MIIIFMPHSNIKLNEKGKSVSIIVDSSIYPLDVVTSASYVFLDNAYIFIDGDPAKKLIVNMIPKKDHDPEKLGMEFNNELLNYAFYKKQSEKNAPVKEAIIQRALMTAELTPEPSPEVPEFEESNADFLDDPEGIAIPWEEKFGDSKKKSGGKKDEC